MESNAFPVFVYIIMALARLKILGEQTRQYLTKKFEKLQYYLLFPLSAGGLLRLLRQ